MDKNTQVKVTQTLNGLPPITFAINCQTLDQISRYSDVEKTCKWLRDSFEAYFSGRESNHHSLPNDEQEFFGLLRDFFLTWYNCIQWGWEDIRQSVAMQGLNLDDYAATPGDALIVFLKHMAEAAMQPAFEGYYRSTPHQTRKLAQSDKEIQKLKNLGRCSEKILNSKIKSYERDLNFLKNPLSKYFNFYENSLKVLDRKKGDISRRHLKEHKKVREMLDGYIQKQNHKSKRRRGYEFRNGIRYEMQPKGGKAS
ncbi:hypothetical protein CAL7716_107680 (plasmid) [Calothrix sp. PCC 7716]|nr:hypothetical protein CAL7716_107680 [Calothrix sp. PCC 7716]